MGELNQARRRSFRWPGAAREMVRTYGSTLYPFVRPGAFVAIDPRQRKIPSTGWHGDHDRPRIGRSSSLELREHYVCTWCEMLDGYLILVPSQQSKRRRQHVRYPAEATIVGRVTTITQGIIESLSDEVRA
jgi:hypothetical protein